MEQEQEEFIGKLMYLEGKDSSHWKREESKKRTSLMEKTGGFRVACVGCKEEGQNEGVKVRARKSEEED